MGEIMTKPHWIAATVVAALACSAASAATVSIDVGGPEAVSASCSGEFGAKSAILDCTAALHGLRPERKWEALFYRGHAYFAQGDYAKARQDFDIAIYLKPRYAYTYFWRGKNSEAQGLRVDAIRDYEAAAALEPQFGEAYNASCWAKAVLWQVDAALADCNKAVQLDGKSLNALDSRGNVYFRMANYPAAMTDFNAVLTVKPDFAPSLYVRGLTRLKMGDEAGGKADIEAAKALIPKIADDYAGYGLKP